MGVSAFACIRSVSQRMGSITALVPSAVFVGVRATPARSRNRQQSCRRRLKDDPVSTTADQISVAVDTEYHRYLILNGRAMGSTRKLAGAFLVGALALAVAGLAGPIKSFASAHLTPRPKIDPLRCHHSWPVAASAVAQARFQELAHDSNGSTVAKFHGGKLGPQPLTKLQARVHPRLRSKPAPRARTAPARAKRA